MPAAQYTVVAEHMARISLTVGSKSRGFRGTFAERMKNAGNPLRVVYRYVRSRLG